jgi:outer membrane biosynthesis protein TonB
LTDDQKAMLRLLAQREEGYDDMAALMGISVEEVRERVKEALAEVEEPPVSEPQPEPPAAPTPTPPAPEPPAAVEPPPAPAVEEPAPTPPAPAPPAGGSAPKPAASKKRSAQIPSLKVPKDRGALIGLGAGALVVVALVIVLIVGGDGGGSSSSSATSGETELAENASASAENKNLTQAVLSADDGSDASGQAIFGRFKKKVLLQVTGEGLEPSSDGDSYAVWLSHSGQAMVPVGTVKVKDSGQLAARFEVPPTVLVLVARGAFDEIEVTRTSDSQLSAAIAAARKTKKESAYTGTPVLSGKITGPLVGAGGSSK